MTRYTEFTPHASAWLRMKVEFAGSVIFLGYGLNMQHRVVTLPESKNVVLKYSFNTWC